MIHFKPLAIEDADCDDADKLIGIMRKIGFTDNIKQMTYQAVEQHKIAQPQLGLTMVPLITLNELYLASCMVPEREVEDIKSHFDYVVSAYDLLKRFSH